MFSGMIQALGTIGGVQAHRGGARGQIACALPGEPLQLGESIAVNGVCLSAVETAGSGFLADISRETLARTTLGGLRPGSKVNLERALRASDRLGGHLVLGHVDATARVAAVRREAEFRTVRLELPAALAGEVAEKGSIAVDGVSLTVAALGDGWFEVALVPVTLASTTLGGLRPGDAVNLETDVLAKYVGRALGRGRRGVEDLWRELAGAPE